MFSDYQLKFSQNLDSDINGSVVWISVKLINNMYTYKLINVFHLFYIF
jgi:hypothetical protein